MSSEWSIVSLEEIVGDVNTGLDAIKRAPIIETYSGLKCLRIQDISQEKPFSDWGNTEVREQDLQKYQLKKDEIIMARTCSPGICYLVKKDLPAVFNNGLARVRAKKDRVLPEFLFYIFKSKNFADYIYGISHGTSVQLNMKVGDLTKYRLALPPLDVQASISNLLMLLDSRIASLRETNATLEAIAQALFKSWFVDFDPVHANADTQAPSLPPEIQALFPATFTDSPKGPIPEGWSYVNLGELVCNQSTTFRFQGIDKVVFINTGDVSEGLFLHQDYVSTDGLPGQAKKAIQRDDILFSEIRPKNKRFAYVNLDPKDYVVSTKFMVLRAISDVSPRYIYQILKQDETIEFFNMIAESRSGTFPQITFDSIQTYQVLKPSKACVDKFIDLVSPIIEQIDLTSERQKELSILRDTLLPRLISGQLRLPEAEKAIAAITD